MAADRAWTRSRAGRTTRRRLRRTLAEAQAALPAGNGTRGLTGAGFRRALEPRSPGDAARGEDIVAGRLERAGVRLQVPPDATPWELSPPSPRLQAALHAHAWLDDLATAGTPEARATAQRWVAGWIAAFGTGEGAGWAPEIAADRLIRWMHHAPFLLAGLDADTTRRFGSAAGGHALLLAENWAAAPPGRARFAALTALLLAGLALAGREGLVTAAQAGLAQQCDQLIDAEGGLASRNPEELLEVFALLAGAAAALREAGLAPGAAHTAALERMAPTLRALRHADGGLARFHGGGAGRDGALDLALADAELRARPRLGGGMGFVRLAARRTTVIADAAPPPPEGHASTLAFEVTSARRPLIVSWGPGARFGQSWQRAGRATEAHATLGLDGAASSRLAPADRLARRPADGPDTAPLAARPATVTLTREGEGHAGSVVISHDGYGASHGFAHVRRLTLAGDGRTLWGEDALLAMTPAQRRRARAVLGAAGPAGIGYVLRFPLHPEVTPDLPPGGATVSLALRSGEIWRFAAEGPGLSLALEPAVYFAPDRTAPRASWQIVIAGRATAQAQQIGWTLAKAQDTPVGIRDLAFDDERPA